MPFREFWTDSPEATIQLAEKIAGSLPVGPTLLIGNLGAGKTTFVKGIARQLAGLSEDEVSSPTFALIHEYGDPPKLYHLDLYRLEEEHEVLGMGIEEIIDKPLPVLIEWGERFPRLWPPGTPAIEIAREPDDRRRIRVEGINQWS